MAEEQIGDLKQVMFLKSCVMFNLCISLKRKLNLHNNSKGQKEASLYDVYIEESEGWREGSESV